MELLIFKMDELDAKLDDHSHQLKALTGHLNVLEAARLLVDEDDNCEEQDYTPKEVLTMRMTWV